MISADVVFIPFKSKGNTQRSTLCGHFACSDAACDGTMACAMPFLSILTSFYPLYKLKQFEALAHIDKSMPPGIQ